MDTNKLIEYALDHASESVLWYKFWFNILIFISSIEFIMLVIALIYFLLQKSAETTFPKETPTTLK